MKSRIKILSGISLLSLIFIVRIEANAQLIPETRLVKEKGWVRAIYLVEGDIIGVQAYNLPTRHNMPESFSMSVGFQIPGRKVTAPEMGRISFHSNFTKRRFSDRPLLTIHSGGRKIELTATRDVWRSESEGYVFESVDFLIPYATFKEIKMTLNGDEFDLPGWIRGQLKNIVGMVGN